MMLPTAAKASCDVIVALIKKKKKIWDKWLFWLSATSKASCEYFCYYIPTSSKKKKTLCAGFHEK